MVDPVLFSKDLLTVETGSSLVDVPINLGQTRQRQILASILASSTAEIAHRILDDGLLLKELTEPLPANPSPAHFEALEHALAFWASASQDLAVRERLQDEKLPFVLYKLLRRPTEGKDSQASMLAAVPQSIVTGVVDLVRTLVAGHEGLEGQLADLLIEDLEHLSKQRDMDFVNKVFLPLIKVERALPVTLGPARSNSESGQPALLGGLSSLLEAGGAVAQGTPTSFLGTSLLQPQQKDYLKSAFLQIVGDKHSKPHAEKLLGSNWSKVHQWSASTGSPPEHLTDLGLWRQLEGRGPCVVLTSGRGPSGQPAVFGAFWQGKVPSIPEHFEPGSALAHDVDAADGDFCFCYLPSESAHHHYTSAEDLPLAQIAVEYEGGVGLAIGGSFMLVSYCTGFESCFGYLDEVDEVTVAGVPVPSKSGASAVPEDLSIEATEIWALEPSNAAGSSSKYSTCPNKHPLEKHSGRVAAYNGIPNCDICSTESLHKHEYFYRCKRDCDFDLCKSCYVKHNPGSRISDIEAEQTRLTSLSSECRHPWVSPAAPFNLFRATPVYMVPAHLTIKAAVQILLKREGEAGLSAAFTSAPIPDLAELSVEQLYG
jgi:hypothetical protein